MKSKTAVLEIIQLVRRDSLPGTHSKPPEWGLPYFRNSGNVEMTGLNPLVLGLAKQDVGQTVRRVQPFTESGAWGDSTMKIGDHSQGE